MNGKFFNLPLFSAFYCLCNALLQSLGNIFTEKIGQYTYNCLYLLLTFQFTHNIIILNVRVSLRTLCKRLSYEGIFKVESFSRQGLVGGAFDFSTHAVASAYPLLKGFVRYYPIDRLRFTFDLSATFCHDPWYIPHIYARQGFDWIILHSRDEYSLSFKEAFEYTTGFASDDALAISGAVDGNMKLGWFDLYGTLGYLFTADSILFDDPHHYIEASVSTRFSIPPENVLSFCF